MDSLPDSEVTRLLRDWGRRSAVLEHELGRARDVLQSALIYIPARQAEARGKVRDEIAAIERLLRLTERESQQNIDELCGRKS